MLDLLDPPQHDLDPPVISWASDESPPVGYDGIEEETEMSTPREELLLRVATAEAMVVHLTAANAELQARCLRLETRALEADRLIIRGAVAVLSVWLGLGTLVMITVFRLAGIDLGQIVTTLAAVLPG